jgi:hypothetical protein
VREISMVLGVRGLTVIYTLLIANARFLSVFSKDDL